MRAKPFGAKSCSSILGDTMKKDRPYHNEIRGVDDENVEATDGENQTDIHSPQ